MRRRVFLISAAAAVAGSSLQKASFSAPASTAVAPLARYGARLASVPGGHLSPEVASNLEVLMEKVWSDSKIYTAGVEVFAKELAMDDFLLPALLMGCREADNSCVEFELDVDDNALLGYRVSKIDVLDSGAFGEAARTLAGSSMREFKASDGSIRIESYVDDPVYLFSDWLKRSNLDTSAIDELDLRVALSWTPHWVVSPPDPPAANHLDNVIDGTLKMARAILSSPLFDAESTLALADISASQDDLTMAAVRAIAWDGPLSNALGGGSPSVEPMLIDARLSQDDCCGVWHRSVRWCQEDTALPLSVSE